MNHICLKRTICFFVALLYFVTGCKQEETVVPRNSTTERHIVNGKVSDFFMPHTSTNNPFLSFPGKTFRVSSGRKPGTEKAFRTQGDTTFLGQTTVVGYTCETTTYTMQFTVDYPSYYFPDNAEVYFDWFLTYNGQPLGSVGSTYGRDANSIQFYLTNPNAGLYGGYVDIMYSDDYYYYTERYYLSAAQITQPHAPCPPPALVSLHRYFGIGAGIHFYTANFGELGHGGGGWVYEGVGASIYDRPATGTVPLYRYYNTRTGRHFYTTSFGELGHGGGGWIYVGVTGYVSPSQVAGTSPLYRYYNRRNGDHFYTKNFGELGGGGGAWIYQGVQCYVW